MNNYILERIYPVDFYKTNPINNIIFQRASNFFNIINFKVRNETQEKHIYNNYSLESKGKIKGLNNYKKNRIRLICFINFIIINLKKYLFWI